MLKNLIRAHQLAATEIKKVSPSAQVGAAHSYVLFQAASRDPITATVVRLADYVWNGYLLKRLRRTLDFIGLNHYFALTYRLWQQVKTVSPTSDLGWSLEPNTLYRSIKAVQRYNRPIIVTEHGCADVEDRYRGKFIAESLTGLEKAVAEGCDVRGYLHWSLLDNFEWDKGFWPRFGLIEVDYQTLERKIRPSAFFYAELIQKYSTGR